MRQVSKEEFFAAIGPQNVHPRPLKDRSEWIDQRTHKLVGVTKPGYLGYTEDGLKIPNTYYLAH